MSSIRKQDPSGSMVFSRSERIFEEGGLWYFSTREAGDIGPFRYESEAQQMLNNFLEELQAKEKKASQPEKLHLRRSAIATISESMISSLSVGR